MLKKTISKDKFRVLAMHYAENKSVEYISNALKIEKHIIKRFLASKTVKKITTAQRTTETIYLKPLTDDFSYVQVASGYEEKRTKKGKK